MTTKQVLRSECLNFELDIKKFTSANSDVPSTCSCGRAKIKNTVEIDYNHWNKSEGYKSSWGCCDMCAKEIEDCRDICIQKQYNNTENVLSTTEEELDSCKKIFVAMDNLNPDEPNKDANTLDVVITEIDARWPKAKEVKE